MNYDEHKEYFERAYKTGADIWTHSPMKTRGAKLIEKLSPGNFVLDIGSGRGLFAKKLADAGFRVIGLDLEENVVKKANAEIEGWGLAGKLKFMHGDALDIPLADTSFDGVCDFNLLENLYQEDWPRYASEINRVLKPGGYYLNVSLSRESEHFFEFSPKSSPSGEFTKYNLHYHFFERDELINIFNPTLKVVSQEIIFREKEQEIALLETLFQKIK